MSTDRNNGRTGKGTLNDRLLDKYKEKAKQQADKIKDPGLRRLFEKKIDRATTRQEIFDVSTDLAKITQDPSPIENAVVPKSNLSQEEDVALGLDLFWLEGNFYTGKKVREFYGSEELPESVKQVTSVVAIIESELDGMGKVEEEIEIDKIANDQLKLTDPLYVFRGVLMSEQVAKDPLYGGKLAKIVKSLTVGLASGKDNRFFTMNLSN